MTKSLLTLLTTFSLTLMLIACSNSPSESTLTDLLQTKLQADGLDEICEVVDVTQITSKKITDTEYQADVRYRLKFKAGFQQLVNEAEKGTLGLEDSFTALMVLAALEEMFGHFKQDEVKEFDDSLTLIKSEGIWFLRE